MGESGEAGGESDDSASDATDSAFEFGEVLDDDTDISDVVDFSGDGDTAGGEDDDPDDESDPPDQPDQDSDDDSAEPEVRDASGSGSEPGSSAGSDTGSSSESASGAEGEPAGTPTASSSGTATSTGSGSESAAGSSDGGTENDAASDPGADESDPDDPDSSDPPDTQDDSGNGGFYDIDPVKESQEAFDFAETQSKAAYEFAYKGATKNPLARYVRKYTSPEVRQRVDEVFSRRMLGSVLVGGAFSKIVEACIGVYFGTASVWRPVAWSGVFLFATWAFVWWDHLAHKATEAAESAAESASQAAESATEKAEQASEAASKAAEAATDATTDSREAAAGGDESGAAPPSGPNTLNEAGTMMDGDPQEPPASQRPRRPRARNRRPNKRFYGDSDVEERQFSSDDEFEMVDRAEVTDGGVGFQPPGDAENR